MSGYSGPMYICITSQKGGVGKTTTAVSLAHGLARAGHPTLLIDTDSQGHCAICLGFDPQPGLFRWLADKEVLDNCTLVARPGWGDEDLVLMPGDSHTKHIPRLYSGPGDFEALCAELTGKGYRIAWDRFEYVLFDTPASGLLQEAAIAIAHLVIIPFRPETLGLDGVAATLDVVEQLAAGRWLLAAGSEESQKPSTKHVAILPVMYDRRLSEHDYNLGVVRQQYGPGSEASSQQLTASSISVADPIPARVAVAEAVAMGKTIWELHTPGAEDVQAAYNKLLQRIEIIQEGLPDGSQRP